YNSEQEILRRSAERFLDERYDYHTYCTIAESETGFSQEIWMDFAKLGWLGLPFTPEEGGGGGGSVELSILMEAMGSHLVLEPYLATVVLGGGLVALLGTAAERRAIVSAVIQD